MLATAAPRSHSTSLPSMPALMATWGRWREKATASVLLSSMCPWSAPCPPREAITRPCASDTTWGWCGAGVQWERGRGGRCGGGDGGQCRRAWLNIRGDKGREAPRPARAWPRELRTPSAYARHMVFDPCSLPHPSPLRT